MGAARSRRAGATRRDSAVSAIEHWAGVWQTRHPTEVSWYEETPAVSLEMIEELGLEPEDPILDVGGGASSLATELSARGYVDLTVADISEEALRQAQGGAPDGIAWVTADVRSHDFGRRFALWHDRAVFHFMTRPEDQAGYVQTAARSIVPGGHLLIATFGPQGPTSCSGLPVVRYAEEALAAALAPVAELESSSLREHETPSGSRQQFLHARLRARDEL